MGRAVKNTADGTASPYHSMQRTGHSMPSARKKGSSRILRKSHYSKQAMQARCRFRRRKRRKAAGGIERRFPQTPSPSLKLCRAAATRGGPVAKGCLNQRMNREATLRKCAALLPSFLRGSRSFSEEDVCTAAFSVRFPDSS